MSYRLNRLRMALLRGDFNNARMHFDLAIYDALDLGDLLELLGAGEGRAVAPEIVRERLEHERDHPDTPTNWLRFMGVAEARARGCLPHASEVEKQEEPSRKDMSDADC